MTPLSLRDVALFAKPPLKGEVGSEAARRGTPLSLRDVAPFAKPPLLGEVGSEAARRGTPLSLRDISPFRGDKLEHCVTLPLLQSLPGKGRWAAKLLGEVTPLSLRDISPFRGDDVP